MSHTVAGSPVSPIQFQPLPLPSRTSSPAPAQAQLQNPPSSPTRQKATWIPFTLRWYFLILPITICLCLGSVLAYITVYSKRNHGLGADDGSSIMLFGWRFLPTLIAVLYAQLTVILFEDVKRTEPFARLAKAPAEGAKAYGTLLQTPRAWWSIFIDICFRRKRLGTTSWALICAALVNVIALLAISPLSSALLTSEEVYVPRALNFTRLVPTGNASIPLVATSEVYYRTLNALLRNTSTSAWITNTSVALPFWPETEPAQFGPRLSSSFTEWNAETTIFQARLSCEEMKLESAEISAKKYTQAYSIQLYGPLNGTQPMVTFALKSSSGCRYELSLHPASDLAAYGGAFFGDATTYMPQESDILPIGGRVFSPNLTATHVYARLNASEKCNGRDIVLMSTPWTARFNLTASMSPMLPENQTYIRSPDFRMRALLCEPQYHMSTQSMTPSMDGNFAAGLKISPSASDKSQEISKDLLDIIKFRKQNMKIDWNRYFDESSLKAATVPTDKIGNFFTGELHPKFPSFTGVAPLLAALSNYDVSVMIDDTGIDQKAAAIKGRFFTEMINEAFNDRRALVPEVTPGTATTLETRVVVYKEIGFTLAALFFTSAVMLLIIFWASRLVHRPLNLRSDPSSTIGLALLLSRGSAGLPRLRSMHDASRVDLYTALQSEKYLTSDAVLVQGDHDTNPPAAIEPRRTWKPRVIYIRMLLALGTLLTAVLVAVLVLNVYSGRSQLSQLAFIYEADVSRLRLSFATFAPISIAPTLTSIVVGLCWDQLDSAFRILQPYISMSRGPTPIRSGAGLTYRSKSWIGAAVKAGRNRHWVLLMISVGSLLAQVLTVSMSALFERDTRTVSQQMSLARDFEIRQVPITTEVEPGGTMIYPTALKVLDTLYLDASKNWLYGASIQQSYNGSQLPWTSGGWSFLPVDLSTIETASGNPSAPSSIVNVTLSVPAIRARLSCNAIEEIANQSSWLMSGNITNEDEYFRPDDFARINGTEKIRSYRIPMDMFEGTDSQTTFLLKRKKVSCCSNGTIDDPQQALSGYWSPVSPPRSQSGRDDFPFESRPWPLSLIVKWMVGKPYNLTVNNLVSTRDKTLFYHDIPQIQAAHCEPLIETAEATITVNKGTGDVLSHTIQDRPAPASSAWTDVFKVHNSTLNSSNNEAVSKTLNVTASYGVMFLASLLGSSDRSLNTVQIMDQRSAFSFLDSENGVSFDLMTYSMYALANKDPKALLNFTTLADCADRTFQTFFQHFVNSGISSRKGGFVYQPINDNSMDTIGPSNNESATAVKDQNLPVRNANRTLIASVSQSRRVLHINTTATYLSAAILIWLILTTLTVICLQHTFMRFMNRDVELIADMLVLIAGSDNLLELVDQKGVELKKNKDIKTMLGWFVDRDGQVRWGVEIVGGRRAVLWVDAPKQGFHVPVPRNRWNRVRTWTKSWW